MELLGWAFGQMAFSSFSTFFYFFIYLTNHGLSEIVPSGVNVSKENLKLWAGFQWQAVQQLFLQEGEKLILKLTSTLSHQGLYSVVANLGSIFVRSIFLPLDEVCYAYFARLLVLKEKKAEAKAVLVIVVKLLMLLGFFVVAFGPPLSFFVIDLIYGPVLSSSSAPDILRVYCLYVSLLGLNGVTEAFVRAVITPEQQYGLNVLLIWFSVAQAGVSYFLLQWGDAVGLVYANCVGMILRLTFSGNFIRKFFMDDPLSVRSLLPPWQLLFLLSFARVVLQFLNSQACNSNIPRTKLLIEIPSMSCWIFMIFGAILFLLSLIIVFIYDRKWIKDVQSLIKRKKED